MQQRDISTFPIETKNYDQIKPCLETFFGFEETFINDLFNDACEEILNSLSQEEREKISSKDFYKFIDEMREKGHTITLYMFNPKEFLALSKKYEVHTATFYVLLIITHIYIKLHYFPILRQFNDIQIEPNLEEQTAYIDNIRPDMLKLFNFINDWKKIPQEEPIILACGSKKLRLDNKSNWMFTAINNYLKTYLNVDNVDAAKEELEIKYSQKAGKKMNKYQSIIAYGIDCLYQDIYQTEEITNEMCCLIRDYLKYIGQPISQDDFDHPDDIKNIRSRIRYLRKTDFKPDWFLEDMEDLPPIRSSYW